MSATAFLSGDSPLLIARLIADPATLETRLDAAADALKQAGMALASRQMLDACSDVLELIAPGDDEAVLRQAIDTYSAPSDAIVAREPFRIPALFVSDMNSTMIGQECIDELADFAG